jgi:hypothetical protein
LTETPWRRDGAERRGTFGYRVHISEFHDPVRLKGIAMINLDDVEHGSARAVSQGLKPYLGRYRGRDPFEGLATERI